MIRAVLLFVVLTGVILTVVLVWPRFEPEFDPVLAEPLSDSSTDAAVTRAETQFAALEALSDGLAAAAASVEAQPQAAPDAAPRTALQHDIPPVVTDAEGPEPVTELEKKVIEALRDGQAVFASADGPALTVEDDKTVIVSDTSYQVQPGDSLAAISFRHYGHTDGVARIFEANRSLLSTPDHVEIGMTLVIPAP